MERVKLQSNTSFRFQIRKDRTGTRASLLRGDFTEAARKDSYAVITGVILVVPVRIETFVLHLTLRLTRGEIGEKPASTLERRRSCRVGAACDV